MIKVYYDIKDYINNNIDEDIRILISDFTLLWNAYEGYLYNTRYKAIYIMAMINRRKNVFNDNSDLIDSFYNRLKKCCINKYGYFSASTLYKNFSMNISDIFKKDDNNIYTEKDAIQKLDNHISMDDSINKLYIMLLIVGRVRNNMFHGIKLIKQLDQHEEIFNISNDILAFVLSATNCLVF